MPGRSFLSLPGEVREAIYEQILTLHAIADDVVLTEKDLRRLAAFKSTCLKSESTSRHAHDEKRVRQERLKPCQVAFLTADPQIFWETWPRVARLCKMQLKLKPLLPKRHGKVSPIVELIHDHCTILTLDVRHPQFKKRLPRAMQTLSTFPRLRDMDLLVDIDDRVPFFTSSVFATSRPRVSGVHRVLRQFCPLHDFVALGDFWINDPKLDQRKDKLAAAESAAAQEEASMAVDEDEAGEDEADEDEADQDEAYEADADQEKVEMEKEEEKQGEVVEQEPEVTEESDPPVDQLLVGFIERYARLESELQRMGEILERMDRRHARMDERHALSDLKREFNTVKEAVSHERRVMVYKRRKGDKEDCLCPANGEEREVVELE